MPNESELYPSLEFPLSSSALSHGPAGSPMEWSNTVLLDEPTIEKAAVLCNGSAD